MDDAIGSMDAAIEALDEDEVAARRAAARRLALISEIDAGEGWREGGATSATGWLAARYAWTRGTAREHVRVARALRDLPAIGEAAGRGLLSWDQLRPLTKLAGPGEDEAWARRAPEMSPAELWREEERRREVSLGQAEDDRAMRRLAMRWDEDRRFLELWGTFASEQGAAIEGALRTHAEEIVLEDAPLDDRAGARLADALEELACSERGRPGRHTLVVHADAAVLAGAAGEAGGGDAGEGEGRAGGAGGSPALCETEDGVRLAAEAARRIACDARIEWVLESEGRPVGIGRRGRTIPGWLSRLLRHRDRVCRFPGCERRSWLKAHHLRHWAGGGPTDLDNLVLLCHAHHRLLHEGGWRTSGHPGGALRFHRPRGDALLSLGAAVGAGSSVARGP